MVSKTKQSKPMSKTMPLPLSGIFGDLPDMVKQQVLEFSQGNGPMKLSYSSKKRSFAMMVNPDFMKETLEYKLNHPPAYKRDSSGRLQVITITPPKVAKYEIWLTRVDRVEARPHMVVIDSKSLKLVKAFNRKYFPKIDNKKLVLGEDMYLTD
jgi:hypothetical protein